MAPSPASSERPTREPRWWKVASTIAYELKPFSLPTKHDIINLASTTRVVLSTIREDVCKATTMGPTVVASMKRLTLRQAGMAAIWLALFMLFVFFEFGLVFFLLSAMGAIYLGTGDTSGRNRSAWSVFNDGFRPLLGTLDAEQIDRDLRHQVDLPEAKEEEQDNEVDAAWELVDDVNNEEEEEEKEGGEAGGEKKSGSRKSGKKARRSYNKEERMRKRDAAMARHDPVNHDDDGWESD